jgi:hypothetical protein
MGVRFAGMAIHRGRAAHYAPNRGFEPRGKALKESQKSKGKGQMAKVKGQKAPFVDHLLGSVRPSPNCCVVFASSVTKLAKCDYHWPAGICSPLFS